MCCVCVGREEREKSEMKGDSKGKGSNMSQIPAARLTSAAQCEIIVPPSSSAPPCQMPTTRFDSNDYGSLGETNTLRVVSHPDL